MKKLISLLLALTVLALPLCSFGEEATATEAAMTALFSNPVVNALMTNLMSGKAVYQQTTFSVDGLEAYAEVEGIGQYVGIVGDLLGALKVNEAMSLSPEQEVFSISLNDAEVLYFAVETNGSDLYAASTLLGDSVVAVSGEEVQSLLKSAGIDLEAIATALNGVTYENLKAFAAGLALTPEVSEVTEQPADADPAGSKVSINLPDDFFANLGAAIVADVQANAQIIESLGGQVNEESLNSFVEGLSKLKYETLEVYLSEDGTKPVAVVAAATNGEETVNCACGMKYVENGCTTTFTLSSSDELNVRSVCEMTYTFGDEIAFDMHMTSEVTAEGETAATEYAVSLQIGVDENGDVVGAASTATASSMLPGLVIRSNSTFCTGDPLTSIATEDAAHPVSMSAEEQETWLNTNLYPNLMVVLGNVLQNAPESVSNLVMQMMGMDAPAAAE